MFPFYDGDTFSKNSRRKNSFKKSPKNTSIKCVYGCTVYMRLYIRTLTDTFETSRATSIHCPFCKYKVRMLALMLSRQTLCANKKCSRTLAHTPATEDMYTWPEYDGPRDYKSEEFRSCRPGFSTLELYIYYYIRSFRPASLERIGRFRPAVCVAYIIHFLHTSSIFIAIIPSHLIVVGGFVTNACAALWREWKRCDERSWALEGHRTTHQIPLNRVGERMRSAVNILSYHVWHRANALTNINETRRACERIFAYFDENMRGFVTRFCNNYCVDILVSWIMYHFLYIF